MSLDFPAPDDAPRIFSTEPGPPDSEDNPVGFRRVLTPIKHQRKVRSLGCAIALYNGIPGSDPRVTISINSWDRVLDAIQDILDTCLPYGGSQKIVNDVTGSLMVYVYEPGAAIEDYFRQNSMEVVSTKGYSPQRTGGYEADAEDSDSAGSVNKYSNREFSPASPQATYCGIGLSKTQCIPHKLETSVLFGNMLSTLAVVSTYA